MALRHGSADYIKILLVHEDNRIVLEISDNGSGFVSSQRTLLPGLEPAWVCEQ